MFLDCYLMIASPFLASWKDRYRTLYFFILSLNVSFSYLLKFNLIFFFFNLACGWRCFEKLPYSFSSSSAVTWHTKEFAKTLLLLLGVSPSITCCFLSHAHTSLSFDTFYSLLDAKMKMRMSLSLFLDETPKSASFFFWRLAVHLLLYSVLLVFWSQIAKVISSFSRFIYLYSILYSFPSSLSSSLILASNLWPSSFALLLSSSNELASDE